MLQKKICMLGSYAVGKTSLVTRFVKSLYSDTYHTTIGVKIDKKTVTVGETTVNCMIWDIAGEDEFYTIKSSYLRGMSGYLLVLDGTRHISLEVARNIQQRVEALFPGLPFVLVVNKHDLLSDWEITERELDEFSPAPCAVIHTSAKTGKDVELAFQQLASAMLSTGQQDGTDE